MYEVIVVGSGQAGLSMGYFLKKNGVNFVVLEGSGQTAGSWPTYYNSLQLFSPVQYSSLPGLDMPGEKNHYPTKKEIITYLNEYRLHFDLPVKTNKKVINITKPDELFLVETEDGNVYRSKQVVCATGPFTNPFIPDIEGQERFGGKIVHSLHYKEPKPFVGKSVMVVGGRNSAVQIAVELSKVAKVTIASRAPITYLPQRIFGKDIHFWTRLIGYDRIPIGKWLTVKDKEPVIDSGKYKTAIEMENNPSRSSMFTRFTENSVIWPNGRKEKVDAVVFATGFTPSFPYVNMMHALNQDGIHFHSGGVSNSVEGLYFIGLPWQRSHASATLRGVGADAKVLWKSINKLIRTSQ